MKEFTQFHLMHQLNAPTYKLFCLMPSCYYMHRPRTDADAGFVDKAG